MLRRERINGGQIARSSCTVWDRGSYETPGGAEAVKGRLEFTLHGQKLQGAFILIRTRGGRPGKENWLLIKRHDPFARADGKVEQIGESKPKKTMPRPAAVRAAKAARKVELSSPDKVLFPRIGISKREVFEFYRRIAPRLLPHLKDRPATLERVPEGLGNGARPHFWQKNASDYFPAWIQRAQLPTKEGRTVQYVLVNDVDSLLYLVNQGTITFHVWPSRVQDLAVPDYVLFDLDPSGGTFADVVAVAANLHEILKEERIEPYVKTSGKTGLHVLTAWAGKGGYDQARAWAQKMARRVVEALPEQATIERSKAKRGRRVYVDVMQNALGHHAVPPYVLRAVPAASVSTPLDWKEVTPALDPTEFNLKTIFRRLARQKRDPFAPLPRG